MTPTPVVARIEDFEVGQHASFRKTFTDEDVRRFIEITGDTNPLHVDDEFAARTQFGRRVIHGMLTASIFSTMVGMLLPGKGAIYRSQTDRARHRLEIDAWIENESGQRVIEGTCEAGLLRPINR